MAPSYISSTASGRRIEHQNHEASSLVELPDTESEIPQSLRNQLLVLRFILSEARQTPKLLIQTARKEGPNIFFGIQESQWGLLKTHSY